MWNLLLHGMIASLNAVRQYNEMLNEEKEITKNSNIPSEQTINRNKIIFPENTMIGALSKYISTPNEKFQPMNANFGIIPELEEKIRDKKLKYEKLADRAIKELKEYLYKLEN